METYDVGFYKGENEVNIEKLPTNTLTLTFKTSFTQGDKVVVLCGDSKVTDAIVGPEGVVTFKTTHLSTWTLRKEAGATGRYVQFDNNTGNDIHLTPGYVYIAKGKTTYGEVKENDNYLVQIETTGGTILTLAKADAQGLKIPCNKTGKMSVWQVGAETDITAIKNSTIQGKQVIYQQDLTSMQVVEAPST